MTCDTIWELINLELDDQLTEDEAIQLNHHRATCSQCSMLSEQLQTMHNMLVDIGQEDAPAGFTERVMEKIHHEKKVIPFRRRMMRYGSLVAAVALCFGLYQMEMNPASKVDGATPDALTTPAAVRSSESMPSPKIETPSNEFNMTLFVEHEALESPPALYAHTGDDTVYELVLGGYSWSYEDSVLNADALSYEQMAYDEKSTITLDTQANETLFFSTSPDKNVEGMPLKIIAFYQNNGVEELQFDSLYDDNLVEIIAPNEENTCFYGFALEFEQGKVYYGLRVDAVS